MLPRVGYVCPGGQVQNETGVANSLAPDRAYVTFMLSVAGGAFLPAVPTANAEGRGAAEEAAIRWVVRGWDPVKSASMAGGRANGVPAVGVLRDPWKQKKLRAHAERGRQRRGLCRGKTATPGRTPAAGRAGCGATIKKDACMRTRHMSAHR